MRHELFTDTAAASLRSAPDMGAWLLTNDRYLGAPPYLDEEAVSLCFLDEVQPSCMEIPATVHADQDKAGLESNAYIILDYQGPDGFRFVGIDVGHD